jgi:hypothetical protein
MDELGASIQAYEQQLNQVRQALLAAGPNDELHTLKGNLEQLIELTKHSLLEKKKQELLELVDASSKEDPPPKEQHQPSTSPNPEKHKAHLENLESMIGVKCRAPYRSKLESNSYHNAVIFAYEESTAVCANTLEEVAVRVVFLVPVETSMVACQFFMDGKCKFSDSMCKYSHGELVRLSDLKEYHEPDYSGLKEGDLVLAKGVGCSVWEHATVDMICGQELLVKMNASTSETLTRDCVWPLCGGDDETIDTPSRLHHSGYDLSVAIERIDPTADALGDWERFTRGIGSKLMAKMGYIHGSGLGKSSEGRVEPVPTTIYPAGRSLDWCVEKRSEVHNMETIARQDTKREENKFLKRMQREAKRKAQEESVFNLLNAACTSSNNGALPKLRKDETMAKETVPNKDEGKSLQVRSLKVAQDMKRLRQEISRLEESASRHKGKDKATYNSITLNIQSKQRYLGQLEQESKSVASQQDRAKGRKKLTIF